MSQPLLLTVFRSDLPMVIERPKTTGKRSETNHFWGHCRDILDQLQLPKNMLHQVAEAVLTADAGGLDDWPLVDGEPLPWKLVTGTLAQLAIHRAHFFADYHGLSLVEYDETGHEYRVSY